MTNIYKPLKNPDEDKLKMQSAETVSTAAHPAESSIAVSDKPAEYSQASTQTTTENQPAQPAPAEIQPAPDEPEPTQPTQSEPSATSETSPASPASQEEEPLYVGGYEMPSYEESPWAAKAKEVLEQYDGYTYEDFLASPQYQELQEQYAMAGQQSMQDTLGQVSARTGGIASTYATAAAQKNYDQFMRALFEVANQMYDAEREEIKSKYGLYDAEEDEDYDRYLDSLAWYNNERSVASTQASAEQALARKQVDSMIDEGKMPPDELIDQSGYNKGYVEEMVVMNKVDDTHHSTGQVKSKEYENIRDVIINHPEQFSSQKDKAQYVCKKYFDGLIEYFEVDMLLNELGVETIFSGDHHSNGQKMSDEYKNFDEELQKMVDDGDSDIIIANKIKMYFLSRLIYDYEAEMLISKYLEVGGDNAD